MRKSQAENRHTERSNKDQAAVNAVEARSPLQRSSATKSWLSGKINKTGKALDEVTEIEKTRAKLEKKHYIRG